MLIPKLATTLKDYTRRQFVSDLTTGLIVGVANVVTPVLGGMPATGAIARTATNVRAGGRARDRYRTRPDCAPHHTGAGSRWYSWFGSLDLAIAMSGQIASNKPKTRRTPVAW